MGYIAYGTDKDGGTQYISAADRHRGTVATLDVPVNAYSTDKFTAKIDMRYTSPEDKKLKIMKFDLTCVRH